MKLRISETEGELTGSQTKLKYFEERIYQLTQENNDFKTIQSKKINNLASEKEQMNNQFNMKLQMLQDRIRELEEKNQMLYVYKEKNEALIKQKEEFQNIIQSQMQQNESKLQQEKL